MDDTLIMQAVNITVIGMGTVFVFLVVMIALMWLLGKAVQIMEVYFPQAVPAVQSAADDMPLIAAAIAAAKRFQGK